MILIAFYLTHDKVLVLNMFTSARPNMHEKLNWYSRRKLQIHLLELASCLFPNHRRLPLSTEVLFEFMPEW